MFDTICVIADYVSPHWLSEYFPARLKELQNEWAERHEHHKPDPWHGLIRVAGPFAKGRARVAELANGTVVQATQDLHALLLAAAGYEPHREVLETVRDGVPVAVPLAVRIHGAAGEALHVLEAEAIPSADDLLDARLLDPVRIEETGGRAAHEETVGKALSVLFLTDDAPRYALVIAGGWLLLTDADRWRDGKYLALDAETALARGDARRTGELAWHAGLWSADVLLPRDDAPPSMDGYLAESVKHSVGVSKDLREGLRVSVELLAAEVLRVRRERSLPVEGIQDLPREMIRQSLRFLYRILFLLFAEARPELGVLPSGDPDYAVGYGLDRLRELAQVELATPQARNGHHIHDSLRLLFRLVNDGHQGGSDGLSFESLRSDLFDVGNTPLIDGESDPPGDRIDLRNEVLQRILQLLLLSKVKRGANRGYVSYAQLGINQLGAVYEGLMAYSGRFAETDLAELAPDGDPAKGTWVVPVDRLHDYDPKHYVYREDPDTGEKRQVRHAKGAFVFRLSGRDRQRSASYYTPEVLTRCVVKHALAELLDQDGKKTSARDILRLTVCEPALGSGAFLNEAINQLARTYLDRIQEERGELIPPEKMQEEERKVRTHLALHQCYGVDLNQTAVELAEVSLWLNVMHPGLRGPWFGLHLRRGNSLIGARRSVYKGVPLKWFNEPPLDRPLSAGPIGDGEVHHFLLPAHGWGAVGADKRAKELASFEAERLRKWATAIKSRPSASQVKRLQALARRVERVWQLAQRRLEIAEQEVARHIDVWGADSSWLPTSRGAVPREQIESELNDPDSMYQRLQLAMDAWCALWFWPVQPGSGLPPNLDEWSATLEDILGVEPTAVRGRKAAGEDRLGLFADIRSWDELAEADHNERALHNMKALLSLQIDHPWLGTVREIAEREGFFHWELDFAPVFARGGFDLQVGNPPWVRPRWEENLMLAESEPFFKLADRIPEEIFHSRRDAVLREGAARTAYLADLASSIGMNEHLGSAIEHQVLSGVQTNLYMNFMERTWRSMRMTCAVGLLHPDSHFSDPKAIGLREATYPRLRRSWSFRNELQLFEEVDHHATFGVGIYGRPRETKFLSIAGLFDPETVDASLCHDGSGPEPGLQLPWGGWDLRPHKSRVVTVDRAVLASGALLFDAPGTSPTQARLIRPLTVDHLEVLRIMATQPRRMADSSYKWTRGWEEDKAKQNGYIKWGTSRPDSWTDVVLQGPHFFVATPFAKQPNDPCLNKNDYSDWVLESLPARVIPRTNYQRACDIDRYGLGLVRWNGDPYNSRWRLLWRNMVDPGNERTLSAAIILPGPTHVNTVHSLALPTNRATAFVAGLWVSVPLDYLVKVSGNSHVQAEFVDRFPVPMLHPAASLLLLRTLRLNCLTQDYGPLWEELFEDRFAGDRWTSLFQWRAPLGDVTQEWTMETPLRTEYDRRAALVEIDALVAIMLGITAEQLCAIYRAQFGVLRKYEYRMFFDAQGRKIAKETHARGWKQQQGDYELAEQWYRNYEEVRENAVDPAAIPAPDLPAQLRERYCAPLVKPDREAEMTAAYNDFAARLAHTESSA